MSIQSLPPPRTLVQIHYHSRPGGVTRVMADYAGAFRRINGSSNAGTICLCRVNTRPGESTGEAQWIDLPTCDYHRFRSVRSFMRMRHQLLNALRRLIFTPERAKPICVIGHNLTLGKNLALSAAFAELARLYRQDDQVRFVSVIHDLAEEGRADQLRGIRAIEEAGVSIRKDLYPADVKFAVLNRHLRDTLGEAGIVADLLPNLVLPPGKLSFGVRRRTAVAAALGRLAEEDGTRFNPKKRTMLYPVRVVSRKNVLEAVIVAVFGFRANLLLGGQGTSRADVRLYRKLLEFCRTHRLPVVLDCARVGRYLPRECESPGNPFPLLYRYSDTVLSTSIAEGFGYTLHEPWLLGKAVIGRHPIGFTPFGGLRLNHLYRTFPVPSSWVNLREVAAKYHALLQGCLGESHPNLHTPSELHRQLHAHFLHRDGIDFGLIDEEQQWSILCRIAGMGGALTETMKRRLSRQHRAPKGADGNPTDSLPIAENAEILAKKFGPAAFDRRLAQCLAAEPNSSKTGAPTDHDALLKAFCNLSRLRLLMTPGA